MKNIGFVTDNKIIQKYAERVFEISDKLLKLFVCFQERGHEDFYEFVIHGKILYGEDEIEIATLDLDYNGKRNWNLQSNLFQEVNEKELQIKLEIETAKHLWQADKKIAKMTEEKINRLHYYRYLKASKRDFDWNYDNKMAVFRIADRTTELLNYMYDEAFRLQKIFNEEFKKGNMLFQDYKIEGKLKYHNHNAFGNTNKRTAHFLCEITNLHPALHSVRIRNDTVDTEDERNDKLFISHKPDLLNWNIEVFNSKWVGNHPINYFMHSLFSDSRIYTLNDLVYMNPDDWQPQFYLRFNVCC